MATRRILPPDGANPWRRKEQRTTYQNAWFQVAEHQVVRPDGKAGIYGVVTPKHLALGVVPVDGQLNTWLVGQYRYPLDQYSWEIPEGGGDPSKDTQAEAARELREETGLVAEHWQMLLQLHTSNCFTSEQAVIFLAQDLQQLSPCPDGTEVIRVHKLPLVEAVAAIRQGEITDAISVAGLLSAYALLGQKGRHT